MIRPVMALLLVLLASPAVAECPSDLEAVTRAGHFGARTLGDYRELVLLQTRQRDAALLDMVEQGALVRLPAGKRVCIRDSTRLSYRTLITMPELDQAYWVHLNALDWDW